MQNEKSNADAPAFARANSVIDGLINSGASEGLTKREYAAIHILAAMRSHPETADGDLKANAVEAVNQADALFEFFNYDETHPARHVKLESPRIAILDHVSGIAQVMIDGMPIRTDLILAAYDRGDFGRAL